jgi:CheY-like chemotaxis protein
LKVLVCEDDKDTARLYRLALEERGHTVEVAHDGKECLDKYHKEFVGISSNVSTIREHAQPFDVVLLDYRMPLINGMDIAKEVLTVNPHQRIIFASAYVKETLTLPLKQVVELLQKPFGPDILVDQIEDKEIYSELQNLKVDVAALKEADLKHEQLMELLEILREIHKRRTF